MMKKLSALFIITVLILSISALSGCENREKTTVTSETDSELAKTQKELERIKQDSDELDKYINGLKKEINNLKIENQRLIAQTKRLEAEIIDLKLDLGQVPDSDSADMLDKDAEPADAANNTGSGESETAPQTPPDGNKSAE